MLEAEGGQGQEARPPVKVVVPEIRTQSSEGKLIVLYKVMATLAGDPAQEVTVLRRFKEVSERASERVFGKKACMRLAADCCLALPWPLSVPLQHFFPIRQFDKLDRLVRSAFAGSHLLTSLPPLPGSWDE